METILEAEEIWKTYGEGKKKLEVLKGVSLELEKSRLTSIVGPSGAGKSTLLNILSGLDDPTRGRVSVGGKAIHRLSPRRRAAFLNEKAGFIFQLYHLISDLTALENVMLPAVVGRRASARKRSERARTLLGEMGLSERAAHFPSELSGGERQRVAIARSLMNDPEILFCDEPTGNLDTATGLSVCAFLQKLVTEAHKTVLIVTHDDTISRMSHRVLHLRDGRWEAATAGRRPAGENQQDRTTSGTHHGI